MIKQLCTTIMLAVLTITAQAQESINVDFQYEGNANFSGIKPSLKIDEFTDSRGVAPNLIVEGYQAEAPLSEIVRDAFVQAFSKSGVNLVDSGEDMSVSAEITASTLETVTRDDVESLQLTIRLQISLNDNGRSVYQTRLFGRGRVPVSEGIKAAVHASLNRMVSDVSRDDYFMIELQ